MPSKPGLLADAERRKDRTEQIIAAELAGDFAERLLHEAQFLRREFARAPALERVGRGFEVNACAFERGDVARACAEGAVARFGMAGMVLEFGDEQIEAGAAACRQPQMSAAVA